MKEVFRSDDIMEISILKHMLEDSGIRYFVFDEQMGLAFGTYDGIMARVMVVDEDETAAREVVREFEET